MKQQEETVIRELTKFLKKGDEVRQCDTHGTLLSTTYVMHWLDFCRRQVLVLGGNGELQVVIKDGRNWFTLTSVQIYLERHKVMVLPGNKMKMGPAAAQKPSIN